MSRVPALIGETPFAVVDVETTGFSPLRGDRIVEVAVVRLFGDSTEEYVTLVNPLRDVGPVHIHGLTAADVSEAPMFTEIVGDLLGVLEGAVMVAHNLRFDRDFTQDLPDELGTFAGLVHAPDGSGAKLAAIVVCHAGDPAQAEIDLKGQIEGENSLTIPIEEIVARRNEWPADRDAPIVVYSGSGHRGSMVMTILRTYGYSDVRSLWGGLGAWVEAGYPAAGLPTP